MNGLEIENCDCNGWKTVETRCDSQFMTQLYIQVHTPVCPFEEKFVTLKQICYERKFTHNRVV